MKKEEQLANITYTVFDRVKMEMVDWTGYNAQLLDDLVATGNYLIAENSKLKKEKKFTYEDLKGALSALAGLAILIGMVGWLIIGFISAINMDDKVSAGYKMGQIDAITQERIVYEPYNRGFRLKSPYTTQEMFTTKDTSGKEYTFQLRE